jgi:ribosomal protein S18 acetylase RimI-like enzyme
MLDQLIEAALNARIEQLTLDSRGDNARAHALWRSRGFAEYGRLADFVAVGEARYDKTFGCSICAPASRPSP